MCQIDSVILAAGLLNLGYEELRDNVAQTKGNDKTQSIKVV